MVMKQMRFVHFKDISFLLKLDRNEEVDPCFFQSLDAKANRALECPCIADLRKGPCGVQFSDAFLCFFKSTAEEKGSDCVHPFVALQSCIKANPNAFSKDILDDDEEEKEMEKEKVKTEEPTQDYRVIPPSWSREPQIPKSKL
ncbi:mitochondrial intermembrane space import and assembly protein 40 [Cucumis melo var. makuwa]|uniref:Mitochondrial intermembrane space import and assembly protein 40 homolog n=1 Tax=Cucumis melo var. makuwa TaxID=1194695 RepID=A0A5A7VG35_CUCMM|nr:mitochondrial intermembrane space import and assembly protein 40 [Cucumis melo var. makuwa]TYK15160.1 mitochondrial intermembrane space import and assembly protein 40 [Cucumis melo var. makuwa]